MLDQSKEQGQHLGLGEEINVGDFTHKFAIESCSKVFTLALALEKYGIDFLKKRIGNKNKRMVTLTGNLKKVTYY